MAQTLIQSTDLAATAVPTFTGAAAGLVPTSVGGATNFLRADGSWAAPSGGGGGSVTVTRVTITAPTTWAWEYTSTVVDAAATATSKVQCKLVINSTLDQNGVDELLNMNVYAIPATGSINFTLTKPGPFVGPFYVDYWLA